MKTLSRTCLDYHRQLRLVVGHMLIQKQHSPVSSPLALTPHRRLTYSLSSLLRTITHTHGQCLAFLPLKAMYADALPSSEPREQEDDEVSE